MKEYIDFFESSHFINTIDRTKYRNTQIGSKIKVFPYQDFEIENIDIFILGCGERRRSAGNQLWSHAADTVRAALYQMYDWHDDLKVVDLGNIAEGATVKDTEKALEIVLSELKKLNKTIVLLGGSQDMTIAQYKAFKNNSELINISAIDMLMDIDEKENIDDTSYFLPLFTEPNSCVNHYNHIAFQSYYVNPSILQTLDRLRFDCYRLGNVRSQINEMEPVLRNTHLLTIDLNVLRASEAPFNHNASPNGLFADELCQLIRYAGMSNKLTSIGFYNLFEDQDLNEVGAHTVAQAIWYFVDGFRIRLLEASIDMHQEYEEYHTSIDDILITFRKSKRTTRWWMQLPNKQFIPCSYSDYQIASNNEFPERWFRAQERLT
jgi:formiminoglutamase